MEAVRNCVAASLARNHELHDGGESSAPQFDAKQYSSPSPPVLFKSACEQPPSGPRERCELFQDFDGSSSRRPCRSAWPTTAAPCVLDDQFLQVLSSPAANAVPSGCVPVRMSCRFGLSPMPLVTSP